MTQSLWDHHRRLEDLELAFEALRSLMAAEPGKQVAIRNAVRNLKARGAKGAADLLTDDRTFAPYRR